MVRIKLYLWVLKNLFVSDVRSHINLTELRNRLYENIVFGYLTRYVPREVLTSTSKYDMSDIPIFQYWNKGLTHAPEIVKICVESVKKHTQNMNHIEINDMNFEQYVEIPESIKGKYIKGEISPTHFSEILRFALLRRYGGFWIDSTVYLSDGIENYARNPFFGFSTTPKYL
jgi:hypothetical protein